jgi:serine/threonine protein kinase/WD40 repeat protein
MNEPMSMDGPDDGALVRFLAELEGATDSGEVVLRYSAEFPHLADEFHEMVATRKVFALSVDPEADGGPPARLGDFRIVRELAVGGMGVVYEAVQQPFGRRVAVKTIKRGGRPIPAAVHARFLREQEALARLHHTHIVPIHAAGQEGDLQYYAMPYIAGATFGHLIGLLRSSSSTYSERNTPSLAELADAWRTEPVHGGPSDRFDAGPPARPGSVPAGPPEGPPASLRLSARYLRSVAKVVADAAEALDHAHQAGIIHRDVKPSNLMVDKREHCWVVDFGLASLRAAADGPPGAPAGCDRRAGADRLTDGRIGTRLYMAPEQHEGRADARTDVWGLGVTLYELLTLRRAFDVPERVATDDPPRPRHLVQNLPVDLDSICWKAIRKDPAHRYQTAGELAADLRRWLRFEPVRARPARPIRRLALWARRNRGWAAAIGLALIGLASVLVVAVAGERAERREVHLQQIQRILLTDHGAGWFEDAWAKARQAPRIGGDARLQSRAAATLAGMEARTFKTSPSDTAFIAMAFDPAPGVNRLLMSGADGRVRTWNADTDEIRTSDPRGEGPFAFRPDGTAVQLVRSADRRSVELREVTSSRTLRSFASPVEGRSTIEDWTLAPRGSHVAALIRTVDGAGVVIEEGTAVVWEAESGRLLRRFPARRPTTLALSAGGEVLAAGSEDGRIVVWDVGGGGPVGTLAAGHNRIHGLAFAADPYRRADPGPRALPGAGLLLAAGDAGGEVIVWDLLHRIPRSYSRGSQYDVYAVAFSPDGTTLASCGRGEVKLWDLATGRLLLNLGGGNFLVALAFAPDGKRLAVGRHPGFSHPGGFDVWEIEDGRGIQTLRGLQGRVASVVFSPDGRRVAALAQNWQVGVWDPAMGRLARLLDVPPGVTTDNVGLALSPDGRSLAFSARREAKLWDVESGAERGSWTLPEGLAAPPVFRGPDRLLLCRVETRDGRGAPFYGYDRRKYPLVCVIRDLLAPDPRRPLAVIDDFNLYVHVHMISPDGRHYAVEGLSGSGGEKTRSIHVYEVDTGKRIWTIPSQQPPNDLGAAVQFDPTGKVLAVRLSPGGLPTLLDVDSRRVLGNLDSHPDTLGAGVERWFAGTSGAGGHPAGLGLYRRGTREPLITFLADRPGDGASSRFSRDGQYAAWGWGDGSVHVVDLMEVRRRLAGIGLGW